MRCLFSILNVTTFPWLPSLKCWTPGESFCHDHRAHFTDEETGVERCGDSLTLMQLSVPGKPGSRPGRSECSTLVPATPPLPAFLTVPLFLSLRIPPQPGEHRQCAVFLWGHLLSGRGSSVSVTLPGVSQRLQRARPEVPSSCLCPAPAEEGPCLGLAAHPAGLASSQSPHSLKVWRPGALPSSGRTWTWGGPGQG